MSRTAALDLIVLLPGKDEREAIDALLSSRYESLGISPIRYQILVHPRRDPGCLQEAPAVLQPFVRRARHALVLVDHEGSGRECADANNVADDLRQRLDRSGWCDRADVIILQPEFENWFWSDSPHVESVTGWAQHQPRLRQWLEANDWWPREGEKPTRPKEALVAALREVKKHRSSAMYRRLAELVSLDRCTDFNFRRFKQILRQWFSSRIDEPG